MTSPARSHRSRSASQGESFLEWLELYAKQVAWGAVAIALIAAGYWFYEKSHEAQARNATVALSEAEGALNSGNIPLAQSELERMVKRWEDTEAGKVGRMLLAQVHYQKGEYQAGIDALKPLADGDDPYFASSALALSAGGYEQLGQLPKAAEAYGRAAGKAQFDSNRDVYTASQARTLLRAGKRAEARALWTKLAASPASVSAAEARVRLGELEAKPAS